LASLFASDGFEASKVLEFTSIPTKLNLAITCQEFAKMLEQSKFWTILDLRGSKNPSSTLAIALKKPKISSSLVHANLEFCKEINDKDLELLHDLRYLNLNALHNITDLGILNVVKASSRSLIHFELYWQHSLKNDTLVEIAKTCNQLELLNLSGCQKIQDSGLRALARNCSELINLDITRCPDLSDEGLHFFCSRMSQILSLNLYADSQFTDKGLLSISNLHNLKFLDLCGVGKISSQAVMDIARGCKLLESWNLTWCVNVDDAALFVIAEHCTILKLLSVFGLLKVSDAMLDALAKPGRCWRTLKTLDVHGCPNVKRQADALLLEQFPHLTCFTHHS